MNENIPPNETCANCGTDLAWWIMQPRTKVYKYKADEYFCSHKCMNQHFSVNRNDYEVIN